MASEAGAASPLSARQSMPWRHFDFSRGHGLEVGPLSSPVVPRTHGDVEYVDVLDRDGLLEHYAGDPTVPASAVPEIDHVLFDGTRVRSIPETIGAGPRYDWVMASHVIEHVPDVIGWLDQVAEVTVDGGALVLVVPDRRYTFDHHRPGTSVGQLLQAHEAGDVVPSVRAVYDHFRGAAHVAAADAWAGRPAGYDSRAHTLDEALAHTERARKGEYVDSHVWLFTPGSLVEQLVELRLLGLSQWRVESVHPTARDQLEFYAVLRRLPRDGWDDALLADEPQPGTMPDWLAETAQLHAELAQARETAAALQVEVFSLRTREETAQRQLAALRRRLDHPAIAAARKLRRAVRRARARGR